MEVNVQWLVTAAAVITAVFTLYKYFSQLVRFMDRQREQDDEIKSIKAEQSIIIYGLLACLKGLSEQGCNGPVHEAIDTIETHLNKKAHQ